MLDIRNGAMRTDMIKEFNANRVAQLTPRLTPNFYKLVGNSHLDSEVIGKILSFRAELLKEENHVYLMYFVLIRIKGESLFSSFDEVNRYVDKFTERFRKYNAANLIEYFDAYLGGNSYLKHFNVCDRPWF